MLKDTLKTILLSQREWLQPDNGEITRDIFTKFESLPPFVYIITGVRRAGKSTLLKQILRKLGSLNYFNFEDSRTVEFEVNDFLSLEDLFLELNGDNNLLCFDEIQNVEGWERYVRDAADRKKTILISGSNASLLSRELGTKLTGRHIDYELFPFSYTEFLSFTNKDSGEGSFMSYLTSGGFPTFLGIGKEELLSTLVTDILYRDIFSRYNLRNQDAYKRILRFLLSNIGKETSFNNLKDAFGIGSATSVMDFMGYLNDAYIIFMVPLYHTSLKVQARNSKKIYAIDQGLVNFYSASGSTDYGRLLENFVYLALRRAGYDIWYYKNKRECDFVVRRQKGIHQAFQVSWQVGTHNEKREIEGALDAMQQLNLSAASIITFNQEDEVKVGGRVINLIPGWKWLLEE